MMCSKLSLPLVVRAEIRRTECGGLREWHFMPGSDNFNQERRPGIRQMIDLQEY
jgi:hypothetical protein